MAQLKAAANYLEGLQKALYAHTGYPHTAAHDADVRADDSGWHELMARESPRAGTAAVEEVRNRWESDLARARSDRPTKFEDPILFAMMRRYADDLEDTARGIGWDLPPRPLLGTLPLGQFNAMAIRVPATDEHIIAFQHGLFGFVKLVCEPVAASIPSIDGPEGTIALNTEADAIDGGLMRNDEPVRRLLTFLLAYVVGGDPQFARRYVHERRYLRLAGTIEALLAGAGADTARPGRDRERPFVRARSDSAWGTYFLKQPFASLSVYLLTAAELFVMAHEYGHLRAGHLGVHNDVEQPLGPISIKTSPRRWQQEHEADVHGLILALLTMNRMHGVDIVAGYQGVDLVFSANALVDRAVATVLHGDPDRSLAHETHPPPRLRRAVLRETLSLLADEGLLTDKGDMKRSKGDVKRALELASATETVLELMWRRLEPVFVHAHEEGTSVAPIWTV